ncbi:glycosyltransferase [Nocardia huaxiensis]|uniref:Glycosyltransferase family 1 protein n=1 Tax=Nocardia huaxiensis TaxID=2755382 RepID=A0A7D6VBQ7_9NOCA|nr:glycosyltransferase [Nocardia huaxiensis]QLY30482.1 glycosyltransferase family 1 protein [Nocardia huaxiensis]UFS95919.1 glycosyltransferase [Nocardia huaxiensis]
MSRFVIASMGTRGDVAPLLDVGLRLRDAGHEVVVAAHCLFRDLVTECGLEYRLMGADIEVDMSDPYAVDLSAHGLSDVTRLAWPEGQRFLGNGLLEALADEPADALLLSPLAEYSGFQLAEAKGIPALGLRLFPQSATADHAPSHFGGKHFGGLGNRLAADAGAWFFDTLYREPVAEFRRDLGLPKVSARELRRRRTEAGWTALHGYSPSVSPRPADWRPGLEVTGYWWPPRPVGWEPPADLVDFLDAGPPPVFVGFGSTTEGIDRRAEFSEIVSTALRRYGGRALVQAGWLNLDITGDNVLPIGSVPYDWLFPRISAAIHHAGAGTTSASLRAGVPFAAVPGQADQGFWAHRMRVLGVSPATIPLRKLSVDALVEALRELTTVDSYRDNAARLASRIAQEDGAGVAVKVIEQVVAQR